MTSPDDDLPECTPEEVELALRWELRDGGLTGEVSVRNAGARTCRLTGKPAVLPLGTDGRPLDVRTVVTMELRRPDHVVLAPGERAVAPVGWSAWSGPAAGDQAVVVWGRERHRTEVAVTGPRQPRAAAAPATISSSWFTRR